MEQYKPLFIFGTRPEAIKLAPLIIHLKKKFPKWETKICVTGQHPKLVNDVLNLFGLNCDFQLNSLSNSLCESSAHVLAQLQPVLAYSNPDLILVLGDTTSALMGGLAAFYNRIPVAHIEAGLRTKDLYQPFPEEINRRLLAQLTTLHFTTTDQNRQNLISEGVLENRIFVCGNTGIDALYHALQNCPLTEQLPAYNESKKLILVTCHRRENQGTPLENICNAVLALSAKDDIHFVVPLHPNPDISGLIERKLGDRHNITLCPALDYRTFIEVMTRSYFILSDSGGIEEEAPSLGKPLLIMRNKTERQEVITSGAGFLVGTQTDQILRYAHLLLNDRDTYFKASRTRNLFGDGRASERIAKVLENFWQQMQPSSKGCDSAAKRLAS